MLLAVLATGCRHKGLGFEEDTSMLINVVFDWRNAPDADPASMALYLYERDGGAPLRFIFTGRDGGTISVPYGHYDAVAMNADNSDWALTRNTGARETFEIYTDEVTSLSLLSRSDDPEKEVLKNAPGMLWTANDGDFQVRPTDREVTMTLYPEEAVCHYTVDVYDVENIESLEETTLFTTCSGLAEGHYPLAKTPTDNHVTVPLILTADMKAGSLHGEFLTFGESPNRYKKNILRIHTFPESSRGADDGDGEQNVEAYDFDVSDQAHQAPDPRHVHIVLRGLPLPKTVVVGGGLKPQVDEWITENIPLKM